MLSYTIQKPIILTHLMITPKVCHTDLSWPLNSRSFKCEVAVSQVNVQRILEAESYGTLLADARLASNLEEKPMLQTAYGFLQEF